MDSLDGGRGLDYSARSLAEWVVLILATGPERDSTAIEMLAPATLLVRNDRLTTFNTRKWRMMGGGRKSSLLAGWGWLGDANKGMRWRCEMSRLESSRTTDRWIAWVG